MRSLLLDRGPWDLALTSGGDIAVASNPYAIAQDVACAIKLFQGELWYDTTKGIPYFQNILGQYPALGYVRSQFVAAAEAVPDVANAQASLALGRDRQLTGTVQVTTVGGVTLNIAVGSQGAPRSLATASGDVLSIGGLESLRV